jgi:hypothetical protein
MNTEIDLTWHERPDLESCKRLWKGVLIQGIWDALWREHEAIKRTRSNPRGWVKYWSYDDKARAWIMSDSKDLNSFIGLCELCEVNHALLRRKILEIPVGWYSGEKAVMENK